MAKAIFGHGFPIVPEKFANLIRRNTIGYSTVANGYFNASYIYLGNATCLMLRRF